MEKALDLSRLWLPLLLLLSLPAVLLGIHANTPQLPLYWRSEVLHDALWWSGGFLALGTACHLLRPGRAHQLMLAAAAVYLVKGTGWDICLATLLFFLASWCQGRATLLLLLPGAQVRIHSIPLIIGLLQQLALFGALIHLPVNTPLLYQALLALPLLLLLHRPQRRELAGCIADLLLSPQAELRRIPFPLYAVLLTLVTAVARYAFFPSISGDDNALHLRMWTELSWLQFYSFDFSSQIWAVAPFALDLMHAIVSLAAHADARGALNLGLLTLLLRQLWCVLAHWGLLPQDRLLLLALFVSTPLLGNLLVTLQTELLLALLASIGVRLLLDMDNGWYSARSLGLLACAALACATKLPGAVLGTLLLLPLVWQVWPLQQAQWQAQSVRNRLLLPLWILAATFVALHSYAVAWHFTGNPLFPLYNGVFLSPYNDPVNFSDGRWLGGFSFSSYWSLFFTTSAHYESRDFVAGFQYLFLFPLGLVSLFRWLPARQAWALLLPLLGYGLVMFYSTQYWRYLFPALPLATLAMAPLLRGELASWQRGVAQGTLLVCLLLNLWFYPGISYLMAVPPGAVQSAQAREQATHQWLPEKALSMELNTLATQTRTLFDPDRPFGAMLQGEPWYPMWYAPRRRDLASSIRSAAELKQTLQAEGITHVIWTMSNPPAPGKGEQLMLDHLRQHGLPLRASGEVVLYALAAMPLDYQLHWEGAGSLPLESPTLELAGKSALRLSGHFACSVDSSIIVADLSWNQDTATRRLLPCQDLDVDFSQAIPIPAGATQLVLKLFVNDGNPVVANELRMELH